MQSIFASPAYFSATSVNRVVAFSNDYVELAQQEGIN